MGTSEQHNNNYYKQTIFLHILTVLDQYNNLNRQMYLHKGKRHRLDHLDKIYTKNHYSK